MKRDKKRLKINKRLFNILINDDREPIFYKRKDLAQDSTTAETVAKMS